MGRVTRRASSPRGTECRDARFHLDTGRLNSQTRGRDDRAPVKTNGLPARSRIPYVPLSSRGARHLRARFFATAAKLWSAARLQIALVLLKVVYRPIPRTLAANGDSPRRATAGAAPVKAAQTLLYPAAGMAYLIATEREVIGDTSIASRAIAPGDEPCHLLL